MSNGAKNWTWLRREGRFLSLLHSNEDQMGSLAIFLGHGQIHLADWRTGSGIRQIHPTRNSSNSRTVAADGGTSSSSRSRSTQRA